MIIELSAEIAEGRLDSLLNAMRESLTDFDEIQAYDKRKSELSSREKEALQICMNELFTDALV